MPPGCIICKDPFDCVVDIVIPKCGHLFHNVCIQRWLKPPHKCPACKSKKAQFSLTKLFFPNSVNNIEGSLDALKEQLRAKDIELDARNSAAFVRLWDSVSYNIRSQQLQRAQIELQKKISATERKIKKLSPLRAEQQKLLQANVNLQCELQNMKNIKPIAEGCLDDAKKILMDMKVHVSSEEGKVATQRIATYCAIVKKEIAHLKEEKKKLQNEIGIFNVNRKRNIKQAKRRFSSSATNSSRSAFCGPSPNLGISNNHFSPSSNQDDSTSAYCPSGKNQVATITSGNPSTSNENIQNMEKFDSFTTLSFNQVSEPYTSRLATPAWQSRSSENEGSVAQARYRLRNRAQIKRQIPM